MSVAFQGAVLVAPGVASYIDDLAASSAGTGAARAIAIIGEAERGEGNLPVLFTDAATVRAYYGNASSAKPLVWGIIRAMNSGASQVYGVRVGATTSSTAQILSGDSTAINVTAKEWGLTSNLWSISVGAGTTKGKKVSITLDSGRSYSADNLQKEVLTVERIVRPPASGLKLFITVGSGVITDVSIDSANRGANYFANDTVNIATPGGQGSSNATITITSVNSAGGATAVAVTSGGTGFTTTASSLATSLTSTSARTYDTKAAIVTTGGTTTLTLSETVTKNSATVSEEGTSDAFSFTTYDTIAKLASAINQKYNPSTGLGWKATISPSITDASLKTATLDQFSIKSINNSRNIAADLTKSPVVLTANTQAVLEAINGPILGNFVSGTLESTAGEVTENKIYVFSGGSETAADATQWAAAISSLQALDNVEIIVPITSSSTYQSMVLGHCTQMSSITGKRERIAIFGGPQSQTIAEAKLLASQFNSKRAVVVWPSIKDYDDNNNLLTWAPYYLAATIGGTLISQADIAAPLTNSTVGIRGLGTTASPAEIDDLVSNGVFAIKFESGRGFIVAQSLTTWTGDTKFVRREISTVRAADETLKRVRNSVSGFVGRKNNLSILSDITVTVKGALDSAVQSGLIASTPLLPAYKDLLVRSIGDAIYVDFSISPSIPANYILITAHIL